MPVIEQLKPQRRSSGRVDVIIDGQSAGWITQEVMLEQGVAEGMELGYGELVQLMQESHRRAAKAAAFSALSFKRMSRLQLEQHLEKKGFDEQAVTLAADLMEDYGYINDSQMAQDFKAELMRSRRLGQGAIRQKLRQRGLEMPPGEADDEQLLDENALYHARKAWARSAAKPTKERRAAVWAALARKGFDGERIARAIRLAEEEGEAEE